MVSISSNARIGPGLTAPARFFCAAISLAAAAPALALQAAPAPAPAQQPGTPDSLVINKLVWSAMAAVDQANQTGNYSVLRDLGAPSFQASNSAATLAQVFATLRAQNVDLSYTLTLNPTFQFPPAIQQGGLLRIRGVFPLRPTPIGFDLLYQNIGGQWRIFAIAVIPLVARVQSTPTRR